MSIFRIVVTVAVVSYAGVTNAQTSAREEELLRRIEELERRLAAVERATGTVLSADSPRPAAPTESPAAPQGSPPPPASGAAGLTISGTIDGYYSYNFNRPVGRVNLLRAYDVSSNSFSLNQATLIVERAADVSAGRRFGLRADLQYGQATESQGGNPANEMRPQVYRNLFQAYGTYVVPVGSGLAVDFGKFFSAHGLEGTYTKDQMNYSRSLLFNALPFYHFGFRATYNFSNRIGLTYYLVNGLQQSEDFNGFKSVAFLWTFKPAKVLTWNLNYYTGQENRDVNPVLNPGFPEIASQPGLSIDVLPRAPRGRTHIFDTYVTWTPTGKTTFVAEADSEIARVEPSSPPSRFTGGALYARYQATPRIALTGRGEYVADRALFSGVNQNLKETTFTVDYKPADGFLVRTEWRRDFSDTPFFLTNKPGILKKEQNTATLGLIWWFGKEGSW